MRTDDPADLEFSAEEMRSSADLVLQRVIEHMATVSEQPVRGPVDDAEQCRRLRESAVPERGVPLDLLLGRLFDEWIPRTFNTASPGYLAYIPSGGVFPSALADLI